MNRELPKFASEAEEAQWWFDNRKELDRDFAEAAQRGEVKRVTLEVLRERLKAKSTGESCP